MRSSGVIGLAIEHAHALHVERLPPHHRDPFDGLLVAQAQLEDLPIVTVDRTLARYSVTIVTP
jgi:PIN domain nuclease of toxin-antitoxin system